MKFEIGTVEIVVKTDADGRLTFVTEGYYVAHWNHGEPERRAQPGECLKRFMQIRKSPPPPEAAGTARRPGCSCCGVIGQGGYEIEELDGEFCLDCWLTLAEFFAEHAISILREHGAAPPLASDAARLADVFGFIDDLLTSNPNIIGRNTLQDYARFNRAMMAFEEWKRLRASASAAPEADQKS